MLGSRRREPSASALILSYGAGLRTSSRILVAFRVAQFMSYYLLHFGLFYHISGRARRGPKALCIFSAFTVERDLRFRNFGFDSQRFGCIVMALSVALFCVLFEALTEL